MTQRTGLTRPGGRTARTREAVHAAVRQLLEERGSREVQVAEIAARAGVNPATIHRRWGSRDALLLEVAVTDLNQQQPVPSTGDLGHDLLSYGRQVRAGVETAGGLAFLHAIITAAADPLIGPAGATAVLNDRLHQFQTMLDGIGDDGTLTAIDLVDGLLAPIYFRALLSRPSTLTDEDLSRLIDNLLAINMQRRAHARGAISE